MCIKRHVIILMLLLVSAMHSISVYAADVTYITAEQWAMPRHGERLLKLPVLQEFILHWQQNPEQLIEINYPGGEQGELWLSELTDWLVALGISSANIRTTAGSGNKDIMKLSVLNTGGYK